MRTALYICIVMMLAGSNLLFGQSGEKVRVTEKFETVPLSKVLKTLRKKYNVIFAYDHNEIRKVRVSGNFVESSMEEVLSTISNESGLQYQHTGDAILIFKRQKAAEINAPILTADAGNYTLSGFVQDKNSAESLPFATVQLRGTSNGTIANQDGFFSLFHIPSDTSVVEINYLGYAAQTLQLNGTMLSNNVRVEMTSSSEMMEELVVEDESQTINSGQDVGKIGLNPAKLSSIPTLGEQDVFQFIKLLPGVLGTDETTSNLFIRGSTPDQNLVLFDDFTLYHVDHFYGIFSTFNASAIKNIQVHKSAFDVRYGGRLSSIVDIKGKSGNRLKPGAEIGLNLLSANLMVEFPIGKKLSFLFAARRSYTDVFATNLYKDLYSSVLTPNINPVPINELTFEQIDPSFFYYDVNAKGTFYPSDKDIISVSYFRSRDQSEFGSVIFSNEDLSVSTVENAAWGNDGLGVKWARQWNKKYYSDINFAFSNYQSELQSVEQVRLGFDFDFDFGFDPGIGDVVDGDKTSQFNEVLDYTISWHNEIAASSNHKLEIGTSFTQNETRFTADFNNEIGQQQLEDGWQAAVYLQDNFNLNSQLHLSLGLRTNFYSITNTAYWEPRIKLSYIINDLWKIKGGWGINHQMIHRMIRDDFYSNNPDFWLLADQASIPVASSNQGSIGFIFSENSWVLDIEAFYKYSQDIVRYVPASDDFDLSEGESLSSNSFLSGSGQSAGMDVLLQKSLKKYTGWMGYSLGFSQNTFAELNNREAFPTRQDQRHEIKFINTYSTKGWEFALNWVFGSGRPFSALEGGIVTDDVYINNQYIATENINQERLPPYHRMDLSINKNFQLGKIGLKIGLSVFNVYNQSNVKYRRYTIIDFGDTNPTIIQSDVNFLGLTPNLNLRLKF